MKVGSSFAPSRVMISGRAARREAGVEIAESIEGVVEEDVEAGSDEEGTRASSE